MLELIASAVIMGAGLKAIFNADTKGGRRRRNSNYRDAKGWSHDNHKKLF